MERAWLVEPSPGDLDAALTAFVARKLMTVTRHNDGVMEVKHGSTLAIDLGGTLDWLPIRGAIWYRQEGEGTRVQARIGPRGRPRLLRRRQIQRLYAKKMSSWLEQVADTLRATGRQVREVPPVPRPG
jgi:hypothetical protein